MAVMSGRGSDGGDGTGSKGYDGKGYDDGKGTKGYAGKGYDGKGDTTSDDGKGGKGYDGKGVNCEPGTLQARERREAQLEESSGGDGDDDDECEEDGLVMPGEAGWSDIMAAIRRREARRVEEKKDRELLAVLMCAATW